MIDFGTLTKVSKTYVKENVTARGQSFDGIKFRRSESKAGKADAEKTGAEFSPFIDEKFVFSNKLVESLKLTENGFTEFTDGPKDAEGNVTKVEKVYLALLSDKDKECKILKSTSKGDKKSLSVKAGILTTDLVQAGVLDGEKIGNQFLTLSKVEVNNLPENIFGVYEVVVDTSAVDEDEDEVEAEESSTPTVEATTEEIDF